MNASQSAHRLRSSFWLAGAVKGLGDKGADDRQRPVRASLVGTVTAARDDAAPLCARRDYAFA